MLPNFDAPVSVMWLRRDLRLEDNKALYYALQQKEKLVLCYLLPEPNQPSRSYGRGMSFLYRALEALQKKVIAAGSSIWVGEGNAIAFFKEWLATGQVKKVYANQEIEPALRHRDEEVRHLLASQGVRFQLYNDHLFFSPEEIVKKDGSPYTVYTPYMHQWIARYEEKALSYFPSEKFLSNLYPTLPWALPPTPALSLPLPEPFAWPTIPTDIVAHYAKTRDFPGLATTRLGPHLRWGTLSIRKAVEAGAKSSQEWLKQLIWRDFFSMILYYFPHVVKAPFNPRYQWIPWNLSKENFQRWCEGKTGFPMVDAGMRQLNTTGFMHNRLRMVTANFLVKLLQINWQWGEAYFEEQLTDYELATNNGSWQWVAGCGCDAVPYFRIFNPTLQMEKFDPEQKYIKKWVPEYNSSAYPEPMLHYTEARKKTLALYKTTLAVTS